VSSHDAEFYVQLEPEFVMHSQPPRVRALYAVRMTQGPPKVQKGGTVLVKLRVRVPDAALAPLAPSVLVVIPETLTHPEPIVAEAADANAPEGEH
jgi:hypothetical protein